MTWQRSAELSTGRAEFGFEAIRPYVLPDLIVNFKEPAQTRYWQQPETRPSASGTRTSPATQCKADSAAHEGAVGTREC